MRKLVFYFINVRLIHKFYLTMEKPSWKRIDTTSSKPCPRWGHTCCVVGEEIVFFGGYADSNYMNDVWTYNAINKKWEEIATTGDRPTHRSNCSMNYDAVNEQIIIFGGGGPNKQRFNTINVLDWKTKKWVEIAPKENQPAPWERTYHIAEIKFPYLLVFGGEGVSDLDDLWVFNFNTLGWTEVKLDKDAVRPCARRFHSSCMIGNQIFVIAGCYGKYRCLKDVYSMDITCLVETGKINELHWTEKNISGNSMLTRWGHSSTVYNDKIYVFAGRFSNDLNDLLVIDIQANSLKTVKVSGNSNDLPKARRRHCAGFVGSCMISFGGFNGEYFNDLFYVNVFELSNKMDNSNFLQEQYSHSVNKSELSDGAISTKDNELVYIHSGLIARYFKTYEEFTNYLDDIDHKYSKEGLVTILECLYRGYGRFEQDKLHEQYGIVIGDTLNRRMYVKNLLNQENQRNCLKLAVQSAQKSNDLIIHLSSEEFTTFLQNRRNCWFTDATILVKTSSFFFSEIRVNKLLLCLSSPYFRSIFSGEYCEKNEIELTFSKDYSIVMDVLINFMMLGSIVVPDYFSSQSWMDLAELSEYFCINQLKAVCQSQLCSLISHSNVQQLQIYSQNMQLSNLSMHCASFELKSSLKTNELNNKIINLKESKAKRSCFMKLYETVKFDLMHSTSFQGKEPILKKKNESETTMEQKQNNNECSNA